MPAADVRPTPPTALVTGGSSGLGAALTEHLLQRGWCVHVTHHTHVPLPRANLVPHRLDLRDAAALEAWIARHRAALEGLDLLVNNAGAGVFGPWEDLSAEAVAGQLQLLLGAPLRLTQACWGAMRERQRGMVVQVTSLAALLPMPAAAPYNAAKAGLRQFCRSLEAEPPHACPRLLELQLGDLDTGFNARAETGALDRHPWSGRYWRRQTALGRAGLKPEVVARALLRRVEAGRGGLLRLAPRGQGLAALAGAHLLPWPLTRYLLRRYYHLRS